MKENWREVYRYTHRVVLLGLGITVILPIVLLLIFQYLGPGLLYGIAGSTVSGGYIDGDVLVGFVNPAASIALYVLLIVYTCHVFRVTKNKTPRSTAVAMCIVAGLMVALICSWRIVTT